MLWTVCALALWALSLPAQADEMWLCSFHHAQNTASPERYWLRNGDFMLVVQPHFLPAAIYKVVAHSDPGAVWPPGFSSDPEHNFAPEAAGK